MGNTGIQLGKFGGQNIIANHTTDSTFEQLSAELETRRKEGATNNEEEYRWIIRATLYTERCNITFLQDVNDEAVIAFPDPHELQSCFRGGDDFILRLESPDFTEFRCISNTITGIEANGSQMSAERQQYVGLSDWKDAPWNNYFGTP